jgi:hypothetical protein
VGENHRGEFRRQFFAGIHIAPACGNDYHRPLLNTFPHGDLGFHWILIEYIKAADYLFIHEPKIFPHFNRSRIMGIIVKRCLGALLWRAYLIGVDDAYLDTLFAKGFSRLPLGRSVFTTGQQDKDSQQNQAGREEPKNPLSRGRLRSSAECSGPFLRDFFRRCDALRFSGEQIDRLKGIELLDQVRDFIGELEKPVENPGGTGPAGDERADLRDTGRAV